MEQTYIYAGIGGLVGFGVAWVIHVFQLMKMKKAKNSIGGFLESEKLIKERLQKENAWLLEVKENAQSEHELKLLEYESKIQELKAILKAMDEGILLLQKDNEETQALLNATNPVVHSLKVKLIEANNMIARYKSQAPVK